ncbi:MAG: hypothetical protein LBE86_09565 [Gemmobacter sp.]|jgi:uncharacterized lipoprotein|nr:hypothetical protein [Gemmobacter sp.]
MSSTIRITLALCTVAFLAACGSAKKDQPYDQNEPPLTTEPVYTSKWK